MLYFQLRPSPFPAVTVSKLVRAEEIPLQGKLSSLVTIFFSVLCISLSLCVLLSHPTPGGTSAHHPEKQVGCRFCVIAPCSRMEMRRFGCFVVLLYLILWSICHPSVSRWVTNAFADFQLFYFILFLILICLMKSTEVFYYFFSS